MHFEPFVRDLVYEEDLLPAMRLYFTYRMLQYQGKTYPEGSLKYLEKHLYPYIGPNTINDDVLKTCANPLQTILIYMPPGTLHSWALLAHMLKFASDLGCRYRLELVSDDLKYEGSPDYESTLYIYFNDPEGISKIECHVMRHTFHISCEEGGGHHLFYHSFNEGYKCSVHRCKDFKKMLRLMECPDALNFFELYEGVRR